jgi:hypothetical protein
LEGVVGRDGKEEQGAEFEGTWFLTAKHAKDVKVLATDCTD